MRGAEVTRTGQSVAVGLYVGLLLFGSIGEAWGHGARLPFDQWGGFSAGAVRCQRVIGRAAAQCAASAWAARRGCRTASLNGQGCDEAATTAAIDAARIKALNTIDDSCSERQAIELQYLGSFDLQQDVANFCRAWETAADSAVYGPVTGASPPSAAQRACVDDAADAVESTMQFTFRNRRQCMDRIASLALRAPNRSALLGVAAQRVSAAQAALAARLAARCGAAPFSALYGRAADVFIAGLAVRADCLGAQFYIQQAVLCPDAVCGNGIVEPGEDCDDGNTRNGDACPGTCRVQ